VPKSNLPLDGNLDPMEVVGVETLMDALALAIPGFDSAKKRSSSSGADSAKGSSGGKGGFTKKHGDANDLMDASQRRYAQEERRDLEGAFQD
jgi:hypothetical protein